LPNHALATRLADAYRAGTTVVLAAGDVPESLDAAEAIQDAWMASLGTSHAYKLGATIPAVREALNLPRSFYAPVPDDRLFRDGAAVPMAIARQTGVECEYAFRLARDLLPGPDALGEDEIAAAFDAILPAIEIPGTRYGRLAEYGGAALVADAGALGALVVGEPVTGLDPRALGAAPVRLSVDGTTVAEGSGAVMDGGAFGPIHAFVNRARARGRTLRAGEVVVTGSCTGYEVVARGPTIAAHFEALGRSVSLRFAP